MGDGIGGGQITGRNLAPAPLRGVELCWFGDWKSASFGESKRIINAVRAEYHSAIQQTISLRYRDLRLSLLKWRRYRVAPKSPVRRMEGVVQASASALSPPISNFSACNDSRMSRMNVTRETMRNSRQPMNSTSIRMASS